MYILESDADSVASSRVSSENENDETQSMCFEYESGLSTILATLPSIDKPRRGIFNFSRFLERILMEYIQTKYR